MLRIALTCAAMALAMPALAQDAQTANPGAQMPGQNSGMAASPQGDASSQPQSQSQSQPASQVSSVVDTEFPVYDADKSGELDKNEFSKWVTALKQQEMQATGKSMAPNEMTSWASSAFKTADADHGGSISKTELTRYLGG